MPTPTSRLPCTSTPSPSSLVCTCWHCVAWRCAGQYTISTLKACSPQTAAQVKADFASQMTTNGWASASKVPNDGQFLTTCTTTCWHKGDFLHLRYVQLKDVTDQPGGLALYMMWLFAPPPPGTCNFAYPSGAPPFTTQQGSPFFGPLVSYYLPQSPGAGNHPDEVCSAGDGASIIAYLIKAINMPNSGVKMLSSTTTSLNVEFVTNLYGGFCPTANVDVGLYAGYPGQWYYNYHPPVAQCQ